MMFRGSNRAGDYIEETKTLGPAVEGTSRAIRITVSFDVPNAPSGIPLPTKLNRLFRLYSMQRNTPNADRMPKGDLAMAMTRPHLELVETARDRITIVADFPHLSPAKIGRAHV